MAVKEFVKEMVIKAPEIFLVKCGSLVLDLLKSLPDVEQN